MAQQFIPHFEPSGLGWTEDLKSIKKMEMLAFGGYKREFKERYSEVVDGTMEIDGLEVFKPFPFLDSGTCSETAWYSFLELIGLTEDDMASLCSAYNQDGVDHLVMNWKPQLGYGGQDFIKAYEALQTVITDVDKVVLTTELIRYDTSVYTTEASRVAVSISTYGSVGTVYDTDEYPFSITDPKPEEWYSYGDYDKIHSTYLMKNTGIKFLDSSSVNITGNYSTLIQEAVLTILLISRENFLTYDSLTKTGENTYIVDSTTYKSAIAEEVYIQPFSTAMEDEYPNYHDDLIPHKERKTYLTETDQFETYSGRYQNKLWIFRDFHVEEDDGITDDGIFYNKNGTYYMLVDGLKKSNQKTLGYAIASNMNIYLDVDKGNWFERFVGGLLNFINQILDTGVDLLNYVPWIWVATQAFARIYQKIFGGSLEDALEITRRIEKYILLIVISLATMGTSGIGAGATEEASLIAAESAYIGPITAAESQVYGYGALGLIEGTIEATAWAYAQAIASALNLGITTYEQLIMATTQMLPSDIKELQQEAENDMDAREEAYEEALMDAKRNTLGSLGDHEESDRMSYDGMFNPLDRLEAYNPFRNGGEFSMKYKL